MNVLDFNNLPRRKNYKNIIKDNIGDDATIKFLKNTNWTTDSPALVKKIYRYIISNAARKWPKKWEKSDDLSSICLRSTLNYKEWMKVLHFGGFQFYNNIRRTRIKCMLDIIASCERKNFQYHQDRLFPLRMAICHRIILLRGIDIRREPDLKIDERIIDSTFDRSNDVCEHIRIKVLETYISQGGIYLPEVNDLSFKSIMYLSINNFAKIVGRYKMTCERLLNYLFYEPHSTQYNEPLTPHKHNFKIKINLMFCKIDIKTAISIVNERVVGSWYDFIPRWLWAKIRFIEN